jgi:hypothetical protein
MTGSDRLVLARFEPDVLEAPTMAEWRFRVLGEPLVLDRHEQHDVLDEIGRLRGLIRGVPYDRRVRLNQNPAGLLGEYASLLMEATVRGHAAEDVLPPGIRTRYGECDWFAVSQQVLTAFSEQWAAVRAEEAEHAAQPGRS